MKEKKQRGEIALANKAVIKSNNKYLILFKSDTEDVTPNSFDLPGGADEIRRETSGITEERGQRRI